MPGPQHTQNTQLEKLFSPRFYVQPSRTECPQCPGTPVLNPHCVCMEHYYTLVNLSQKNAGKPFMRVSQDRPKHRPMPVYLGIRTRSLCSQLDCYL